MGIILSALTGSGRKSIKLPPIENINCELIGIYDSVLEEAMQLLLSGTSDGTEDGIPLEKAVASISSRSLKRSEVSTESEVQKFFASYKSNVIFVCHKITSQRTPLLDSKGLYTKFVKKAMEQCEVVLFLLNVPSVAYLYLLLTEQPTLKWLFVMQRLIPIFSRDDEETSTAATDEGSSSPIIKTDKYWHGRVADILQGKLPSLAPYSEDLELNFKANAKPDEFIPEFYVPLSGSSGSPKD